VFTLGAVAIRPGVLAFEPLLDDLHVEQAQEAAAVAKAERGRGLRFVDERGVVEVQTLQGVAQERVIVGVDRVKAGEDHRLGRLVAGQGFVGRPAGQGDRVADLAIGDDLQAGRQIANLAGGEPVDRSHRRPEDAEFQQVGALAGGHQLDGIAGANRAVNDPDVGDDALVAIVV
jgi:hypothetical protein